MSSGPVQDSWRQVGRYRLILEQAKGPLGSLWIGSGSPADSTELVTVRPMVTDSVLSRADVNGLAEAAEWALELEHPNILRAVDVVVTDQELATVSEYREGELLDALLGCAGIEGRPAPSAVTLRVALDVLDALAYIEAEAVSLFQGAARFAHGGLIPDSVFVGADGQTRLLDTGTCAVAQRVVALGEHPKVAAYLSPEQVLHRHADEQSVVFSVGVLMWEMLTAKRLFSGPDFNAVVERVTTDSIAGLDTLRRPGGDVVPEVVAGLVARALERDPIDRFQTSLAMAEAIRTSARNALGSHSEVAEWVSSLSAQSLRGRRDSLESALGVSLNALASARPTPNSGPAAAPMAASRGKKLRVRSNSQEQAPPSSSGAPVSSSGRRKSDRRATTAQDEATIAYAPGASPADLLDSVEPDSSDDPFDGVDELPTAVYRGSHPEPPDGAPSLEPEADAPLPGPEVLHEPAPWARESFLSDLSVPPPRIPAEPAPLATSERPTRPPRPVGVHQLPPLRPPPVFSFSRRAATPVPRAATPEPIEAVQAPTPEPIEAAQAPTPEPIEAAQAPTPEPIEAAQAPTPKPIEAAQAPTPRPIEAAQAPTPEPVGDAQAPTPEPVADAEALAPEPAAVAQAPTPARTHVSQRKLAALALLACAFVAGAAALVSWLRPDRPDPESTSSPQNAPSGSVVPATSETRVDGDKAASTDSVAHPTTPSAEMPEAGAAEAPEPGNATASEAAEGSAPAEPARPTTSTGTSSARAAPTGRPVPKPAKKFLPSDI